MDNRLIKRAAAQLGTTPEELEKSLKSGKLASSMGLTQEQADSFNRALNDKDYAKKILSSPQAQELIRKLNQKEG